SEPLLRRRCDWPVGRADHAGGCWRALDQAEWGERPPMRKETPLCSDDQRVSHQRILVSELWRISDCISSPAQMLVTSCSDCALSRATASAAASPLRSVELRRGNGSCYIRDTTCF